jgi:hypothetical protein
VLRAIGAQTERKEAEEHAGREKHGAERRQADAFCQKFGERGAGGGAVALTTGFGLGKVVINGGKSKLLFGSDN